MKKLLKFIGAVRDSSNSVKVTYELIETGEQFKVEWNNIHPGDGSVMQYYDLQLNVDCDNDELMSRVVSAIEEGEGGDDDALYLEIRDTFNEKEVSEFGLLNLSYEWNDYVVGYVITDENSGRSVNFQADDRNGMLEFTWGCGGDETTSEWERWELEEAYDFLNEQVDAMLVEKNIRKIWNDSEKKEEYEEIIMRGHGITENEIEEITNK